MRERLFLVIYRHFWKPKMRYMNERGFHRIKYKSSHPNVMKDTVWLRVICAVA